MRGDQQLWQQILDAQKEVDELDAAYRASIANTHRGQAFDRGPLNRLTSAKVKLMRLQSEWGRRAGRRQPSRSLKADNAQERFANALGRLISASGLAEDIFRRRRRTALPLSAGSDL